LRNHVDTGILERKNPKHVLLFNWIERRMYPELLESSLNERNGGEEEGGLSSKECKIGIACILIVVSCNDICFHAINSHTVPSE